MRKDNELTQGRLKDLLHYDPDTGVFTWLEDRSNKAKAGSVAGKVFTYQTGKTYRSIGIDYGTYYAHRLACLYMDGYLPTLQTDHINGDGTDNRWCNLRFVHHTENHKNTRLYANNKSGLSGVWWSKRDLCFYAKIYVDKQFKYLGKFTNIFDAACARKRAENIHRFHQNHGEVRPL